MKKQLLTAAALALGLAGAAASQQAVPVRLTPAGTPTLFRDVANAPAGSWAESAPACPQDIGDDGSRFWVGAEYLMWWVTDAPLPVPLLTTGPAAGLGVAGNPGTQLLVGGDAD